jgi:hypothetical protein
MLRQSLLLGNALLTVLALAGAAQAQPRKASREDLLDALTTHIQICAEINDSHDRLACYDKLQTKVGDVQPAAPVPTPLRPAPPPQQAAGPAPGGGYQGTPLAPPPLGVPGGGTATLGRNGGGVQGGMLGPAGPSTDPDAAFDTRGATSSYRPPEGAMPKPQPPVRRTGPRPIPNFSSPQSLVTLTASNLTYGEARYWQVTISITSNTPRTLSTQIQCTFLNAGRPVGDAYFGPADIAAGEQISTELIGPSTTVFVDSTNCRVLSP